MTFGCEPSKPLVVDYPKVMLPMLMVLNGPPSTAGLTYQQEGVVGLYCKEGSGRPKLLEKLTEDELTQIVFTSAITYGYALALH